MDNLLLTFIEATDEAQADRHLTRLIDEHAALIVREILGSSLRIHVDISDQHHRQDAGDLFNDIVVNLISRLRHIKHDLGTMSSLTFVVTWRALHITPAIFICARNFRGGRGSKTGCAISCRTILISHCNDDFGLLCGLAKWRDKTSCVPGRLLEKIRQDPAE